MISIVPLILTLHALTPSGCLFISGAKNFLVAHMYIFQKLYLLKKEKTKVYFFSLSAKNMLKGCVNLSICKLR